MKRINSECCVCGRKIGFMDGYKTLPETNEPICSQCLILISPFCDRIWSSHDVSEIESVKAEALALIDSKGQELQKPEKLKDYLEADVSKRIEYLTGSVVREESDTSMPDQTEVNPAVRYQDDYDKLCSSLLLTTAGTLEGYRIKKQLGVVFGETVFKPSAGQQFTSSVGDMFRSFALSAKEMSGQVSIIEEARKFAATKMMRAAVNRGANAIIAIDSDNTIGDSICYLSLYGTAVYVEPAE
jgi:uncharacterized protein YbjQ (UPF0145 family)